MKPKQYRSGPQLDRECDHLGCYGGPCQFKSVPPPKLLPTCDSCGGVFPRHLHYCNDCMAKAAPNFVAKAFWALVKRWAGGGATCPNCKTPFFLSKANGKWGL